MQHCARDWKVREGGWAGKGEAGTRREGAGTPPLGGDRRSVSGTAVGLHCEGRLAAEALRPY